MSGTGPLYGAEHYALLDQFERDCKPLAGRLDREGKSLWPKGIIYQDGRTNDLFLAYRRGYAYCKSVSRASGEVES